MFSSYTLVAVAPIFGLAAYCAAHVLASRVMRRRGHYLPLFVGCGFGLIATLAISAIGAATSRDGAMDCVALTGMNVVEYLLSFGYFNFINLNIASLRIRMLQELADAGGEMPSAKLTGLYNMETVIGLRIDRLVSGGHLVERQGRFYSGKRKFLIVGRVFDFLRIVILGRQTPRSISSPQVKQEQILQGAP